MIGYDALRCAGIINIPTRKRYHCYIRKLWLFYVEGPELGFLEPLPYYGFFHIKKSRKKILSIVWSASVSSVSIHWRPKNAKGSNFSSHDNIKSSSHIKRISSWLIGFSYMNEYVYTWEKLTILSKKLVKFALKKVSMEGWE